MNHIADYPPGDWHTQRLLARLIRTLWAVNTDEKGRRGLPEEEDFLPYGPGPRGLAERERKRRSAMADMARELHEQRKLEALKSKERTDG